MVLVSEMRYEDNATPIEQGSSLFEDLVLLGRRFAENFQARLGAFGDVVAFRFRHCPPCFGLWSAHANRRVTNAVSLYSFARNYASNPVIIFD